MTLDQRKCEGEGGPLQVCEWSIFQLSIVHQKRRGNVCEFKHISEKKESDRPNPPQPAQIAPSKGNCIELGQNISMQPESVGTPVVGALRGQIWQPIIDANAPARKNHDSRPKKI